MTDDREFVFKIAASKGMTYKLAYKSEQPIAVHVLRNDHGDWRKLWTHGDARRSLTAERAIALAERLIRTRVEGSGYTRHAAIYEMATVTHVLDGSAQAQAMQGVDASPPPDRAGYMADALRRIYAAAQSLEAGEESIIECAQDIQRMVTNGLRGYEVFPWSHNPAAVI